VPSASIPIGILPIGVSLVVQPEEASALVEPIPRSAMFSAAAWRRTENIAR